MAGDVADAEELKAYRYAARCERVRKEWGLHPKPWAILMTLYAAKGDIVPVRDLCQQLAYRSWRTTGGAKRQIASIKVQVSWLRSRAPVRIETKASFNADGSYARLDFGYRLDEASVRRLAEALGDDGR